MEDHAAHAGSAHAWSAELAHQIETEQQRLSLFLGAQRRQIEGLEATLAAQLGSLTGHLAARLEGEHHQAAERLARQNSLLEARAAKLAEESDELEALRARTREQRRRLAEHFQSERPAQVRGGAQHAAADVARLKEQVRRAEDERDDLARQLSELESRPQPSADDSNRQQEAEDVARRLERSLGEVRDLKRRNAELEQQAFIEGKAPAAAAGPLDWEAQKKLFLATLEADAPENEEQRQEHLTIDGTIRITDSIVQEKDREIAELKQLLEEQSQSVGSVAIGAAALGEILDRDAIICQERERLTQLQNDWREKLRSAEIILSVDRAKIARERAEVDELQRSFQEQMQAHGQDARRTGNDPLKTPPRGRWLSRLGLKDNEG